MKHLWQSIQGQPTVFSHFSIHFLLEAASQRVEAQGATLQAKLLSQLDEAPASPLVGDSGKWWILECSNKNDKTTRFMAKKMMDESH